MTAIPPLSLAIAEFLESGLSMNVGTRDAERWPETCRAMGMRIHPNRLGFDLFLPEVRGEVTLANLRSNGLIAVSCSEPPTHRTVQLKGRCQSIRPETPEDRAFIKDYRQRFGAALASIGILPAVTGRVVHAPCWVLAVELQALYEQTPGPGAGARFGEAAR